jgi:hypothetical protein
MKTIYCNKDLLISNEQEPQTNYNKTNELKVEYVLHGIVHPLELPELVKSEHEFFGGMIDDKLNFIDLSLLKRVPPPNFKANSNTWYQSYNSNILQLILDAQAALEMSQCKN